MNKRNIVLFSTIICLALFTFINIILVKSVLGVPAGGNDNNDEIETQRSGVISDDKSLVYISEKDSSTIEIEPKSPQLNNVINVDTFFDNIVNYNQDTDIEIVMTGDVMLGRAVNSYTIQSKDINWPFVNIFSELQKYPLVVTNLENPLIDKCKPTLTGMIFCGNPSHATALKNANIKVASLANNHSLNHGVDGLTQTVKYLDGENITSIGVENPTFYKYGKYVIAFLAYDDIECNPKYIECLSQENILEDLQIAKAKNPDLIVVIPHWGTEYTYQPTKRQIDFAHFLIDNGVDAVLGNHPHWYQSMELYNQKLIVYSHGNFVFDQMWSEQTKQGIVGRYIFKDKMIVDGEFIPVYIKNYGQVSLASESMKSAMLKKLQTISTK